MRARGASRDAPLREASLDHVARRLRRRIDSSRSRNEQCSYLDVRTACGPRTASARTYTPSDHVERRLRRLKLHRARARRGTGTSATARSPAVDRRDATVPTGFSGDPPPGPAMPVTPTPTSTPRARANPVGHRQRHRFAHRAVLRRSAPPARRAAPSSLRSRRRRPTARRSASCPARPSAAT